MGFGGVGFGGGDIGGGGTRRHHIPKKSVQQRINTNSSAA
jgi:hypothetical protein